MNRPPDATCEVSYHLCAEITRRATSNFSWAFAALPAEKRRAMLALYAFARVSDDIADSRLPVEERRVQLDQLRAALQGALESQPSLPFLPAMVDTIRRYEIPPAYLHDILDGVTMDLEQSRYETFAELETYCHRVATAVGLACIHIWGFQRSDHVEPLVHKCGLAFQITNILRDLKEDAMNDRIYLPREELAQFRYDLADLHNGVVDARFRELMQFQVARARQWFRDSAELQYDLHPDGQRIYPLLHDTYSRLLDAIARRDGDVFRRRVRLGMAQRFQIAWGQWRRKRAVRRSRHVAYSS